MQPLLSKKRNRTGSREPAQQKVARISSSTLPERILGDEENGTSPQDNVLQIIRSQGIDVEIRQSLNMVDFFAEYIEEERAAYDADVLKAIRSRDIGKFREYHQSGRPLKCNNNFGESLLHMACRRGFYEAVSFLIH